MAHRTHRTDTTQASIVAALRQVGCGIVPIASLVPGVPDLLVARLTPDGPLTLLIEVKGPHTPTTPAQVAFRETWPGVVVVVRTVQEALAAVGIEEAPR